MVLSTGGWRIRVGVLEGVGLRGGWGLGVRV